MVRKQHSPKEIAAWTALSLLVLGVLMFYLWHLNENIRIGWASAKLEKTFESLREEVGRLETKKAALLALDRVERIGRTELKLVDPRDDQIVYEDR